MDEDERVRSLRRVVTTTADPALDRLASLASLAARLTGAPAAPVPLLSDARTTSAAAGLDPRDRVVGALADSPGDATATAGGALVVTGAVRGGRVAVRGAGKVGRVCA